VSFDKGAGSFAAGYALACVGAGSEGLSLRPPKQQNMKKLFNFNLYKIRNNIDL